MGRTAADMAARRGMRLITAALFCGPLMSLLTVAHVAAGTYGEPNLVVGKSVTLAGAGSATTTMDAGYQSRVLLITANTTVTVNGFTITRGYPGRATTAGQSSIKGI